MITEFEIILEIPQGKIRGKKDISIHGMEFFSFHKIPYAKPPVGELRFKAPEPAEGWTDIRDATEEGPVCPSLDWDKKKLVSNCKEDSLFINVYCKQNPVFNGKKKCAVMIMIHGGGSEFGSGNKSMASPDYLMHHDIIFVTFNHRLGVLGFLSLETVDCPGNYGLKDQQLAFKWVKDNISYFGGDPENITIFGISFGGASVHYQTLCLSNKGLFAKAIIQSASALCRWAHSRHPRKNAFALGKRMGCNTQDDKVLLDFLKKARFEDIVVKAWGLIDETEGEALGEQHIFNFTFVPSVEPEHEGAFITEHPWALLRDGKYLDVPLITGIASREMIVGVKGINDYPRFTKLAEYQKLIPRDLQVLKDSDRSIAIAKRIKEFYFREGINLDNYIKFLSDDFFNYWVLKYARVRCVNKNIKSPTYLYVFTYEGDQTILKNMMQLNQIRGASHGDDYGYLIKGNFSNLEKIQHGSRDYGFMMKFTKVWTNFAKTGVPSLSDSSVKWKKVTAKNMEYLIVGDECCMKKGLLKGRLEFWDGLYSANYD